MIEFLDSASIALASRAVLETGATMTKSTYHVAQMSISLAREPLDHPSMQGFVSQLPDINSLADRSPGFVWRLQTAQGDSTGVRGFEDPMILLNMSLWESVEALFDYVYKSAHIGPFRDRRKWFKPLDGPVTVLWWVPAGHYPTVAEGRARLELLARQGPSPEAFDFKRRFPAPEQLVSAEGSPRAEAKAGT